MAGVDLGALEVCGEQESDYEAIHVLTEMAFGETRVAEAADALRANAKVILSLVAVLDGRLVGHVMFSPCTIETADGTVVQAALGPISVVPDLQHQGIGSTLVRTGLEECRKLGYGGVFLLGNPAYYGRFGFRPAQVFGILFVRPLSNPDAFQAAELWPEALAGISGVGREEPELD